jgi:uncharacterized FlgJ-related protein
MKNPILKSACCYENVKQIVDNKYICKKCKNECKTYNDSVVSAITLFLVITVITLLVFTCNSANDYKIFKTIKTNEVQDVELNDSAITVKLVELGCVLPNVALAQIKLESGNYTSKLVKTNKNLLGIKKGNKYRVYNTYTECLEHYIKIQNRYLKAIDGKYAEDSSYIYKLKNMK